MREVCVRVRLVAGRGWCSSTRAEVERRLDQKKKSAHHQHHPSPEGEPDDAHRRLIDRSQASAARGAAEQARPTPASGGVAEEKSIFETGEENEATGRKQEGKEAETTGEIKL